MSDFESLSDSELAEIETRASAATAGPWEAFLESEGPIGGDDFIRIGDMDDSRPDMYVQYYLGADRVKVPPEDLKFIAWARQDIPRLIAEVKRLRSSLEQ